MRRADSSVRAAARAGLFLLVVAVYLPSYGNEFVYDDGIEVQRLESPQGPGDLARILSQPHYPGLPYYRPITRASLLLDRSLFGDRPGPYRLVNAVLAGCAALLAYAILRLPGLGTLPHPIALAAAAVFGLHPVTSSVVYSISCRGTILEAVLALAAVHAYLRGGALRTAAAMLAVAAALFSKEQAISLPLLLLLADGLGISANAPGRNAGRWLARIAPLAAIAAGYWLVRNAVTSSVASQVAPAWDPLAPVLSVLYGLQVTLLPFVDLVYEPPPESWLSGARLAICAVTLIAFVGVAARSGPELRRRLLFFAGWFALALVPTANLLVQETRFAERYVFLATFGVIGAVASLGAVAWRRDRGRSGIVALAIGLVVACGTISVHRSAAFRDDRSFALQWLNTNPRAIQAHKLLGDVYAAEGANEAAARHFRAAIRIDPLFFKAHANLANLLYGAGQVDTAIAHAAIAARLDPGNSRLHRNLARMYAGRDDLELAARHYRRALELSPRNVAVAIPLARVLARLGRPADAAAWVREFLRAEPGNVNAHYELGKLLLLQGQVAAGTDAFEAALALEPNHARAARALAAIAAGDLAAVPD
jgi:tetratricopeptide (TPR) repeat protein